jgi:crossover junction endodeoxyribonuclease RuvC
MAEYRIGIDPGITGALALLKYDLDAIFPKIMAWSDMPVMALAKNKQMVNAAELFKLLKSWRADNLVVYLEYVSAMPGQGVSGMFNFGVGYGMVQAIVASLQYPLMFVRPTVWKKKAGLLHTEKDKARAHAQQLFPGMDLRYKKDVGRADAILIAMYGK